MSSRPLIFSILLLASITGFGGDWPQFRGPDRNNISKETGLYRTWPAQGPKVLWKTTVCEGYAGAAIKDGLVYVNDYDFEKKEHLIRCLSLTDGKDVWRRSFPVEIRSNHGITRTVPAIGQNLVFSLDPKCRFYALDAKTGNPVWQKNLVQEYNTKIPIRLTIYDDESDPTKAVSKLETLYSDQKVVAYLGGFGSDLHAAAAAIAEKNKVPYIGVAFALYKVHQQGFKYLFSPFPKSPAIAVATFDMSRNCTVRLEAIRLTLSVKSFHVPATPFTSA